MSATLLPPAPSAVPAALLRLDDPAGVLSVALCPGEAAHRRVVRDKLAVLAERALRWRARDRRALTAVADHVEERVAALRDDGPVAAALFATIAGGELRVVELDAAVPCSVALAARAQLGPLLMAGQDARPAGLVLLHGDDAEPEVLEVRGPALAFPLRPAAWDVVCVAGAGELPGIAAGLPCLELPPSARSLPRAALAALAHREALADRDARAAALRATASCSGARAVTRALRHGLVERVVLTAPAPAPLAGGPAPAWPPAAEALAREAVAAGVPLTIAPPAPRAAPVAAVLAR